MQDWMDDVEREEEWVIEFLKVIAIACGIVFLTFFVSLFILWLAYFWI